MKFIFVFLALTGCSFERYHAPGSAEVKLIVPREALENKNHLLGGPGSYPTIDCFLLDVNGPGIDAMYDDSNPFAALDLGRNSGWVLRTDLVAAGSTSMSIRVPIGRSRTVRILGVTGSPAITNCAALTFSGYPNSGVLSSPPYPLVFELARATLDVFLPKTVSTVVAADPAQDMMPTVLQNAPGRAVFTAGNAVSDFSEGAPPGAGGFQTFAVPISTDTVTGKARLDIVLNIQGMNVQTYRGVQVQLQAAGGAVACGAGNSPAIATPSNLTIGLWKESDFVWTKQDGFIPSGQQASVHTANFAGLNIEDVRTTTTDGTGTFTSLYLSLRVETTPATGCSAINLTSATATLFQ